MSNAHQEFKHLLSPFKIGSVEIKNRFVFLPHVPNFAKNHLPTPDSTNYWSERAKGGAGLIILETQAAHPDGAMCPENVFAFDKRTIPEYRRMTDKIHGYGLLCDNRTKSERP